MYDLESFTMVVEGAAVRLTEILSSVFPNDFRPWTATGTFHTTAPTPMQTVFTTTERITVTSTSSAEPTGVREPVVRREDAPDEQLPWEDHQLLWRQAWNDKPLRIQVCIMLVDWTNAAFEHVKRRMSWCGCVGAKILQCSPLTFCTLRLLGVMFGYYGYVSRIQV
ncbi:uncharacterized protein LTR77_007072 [Saxophila tyrrhenica]|uniref:Uncharacterized protein n=1 Tax=Saxophila tyrrhenica TaxID=1690608 RepID=A0AAV9P4E8_9PEZI|nr:hypothetical protein LTR77_007072 [Saxophila tyrrhenica]